MSKFLLNLLVQISKTFVYSKIQILFRNNSPQLSAHPVFRPSRGPFLFFPTGRSPSPHLASASQPAQPACVSVAPYPIAAFLPGKRLQSRCLRPPFAPAERWTPPVISHLRPAQAQLCRHHLPPLPTPPSSTSDAARAFTTPPSLPPP
jgi:hypothetical protein